MSENTPDSPAAEFPALRISPNYTGQLITLCRLTRVRAQMNGQPTESLTRLIRLFKSGDLNCREEGSQKSALHLAMEYGHDNVADALLHRAESTGEETLHAVLCAVDAEGNTPMHLTADYDLVSLLMDYGADPTLLNHRGENGMHALLHCMSASGDEEMMARAERLRAAIAVTSEAQENEEN